MKFALIVEGTRGDVYPLLRLGASLVAEGHGVRLCAPPDFEQVAIAHGLEFWSLGVNVREFMDGAAAALHGGGLSMIREMDRFARVSIVNQFRLLPIVAAGMDRVIAAGTITGAASAAELHDIPYQYVAYTPALLQSAQHGPAFFPFQLRSRWVNRLLWGFVKAAIRLGVGRQINTQRRMLGLAPVSDAMRHVSSERPVVAVDRPLASVPDDHPFEYDQIRCLHPLGGERLPAKLQSFLDAGRRPVYLGFGSMPDPKPVETTQRLLAAIERIGCRALISRGWAGLGAASLPEGVMVIDPVAHQTLFPQLAAVVHHGGAGTTHSAARAGVPQIVIPHVLDQFYFARRVEDLGVGPPALFRRKLNVENLTELLRTTLENEFVARRAQELGEELAALGPANLDVFTR
jgi:UDP:flavonoid glycosyltransferase YjiC (YdhE family)